MTTIIVYDNNADSGSSDDDDDDRKPKDKGDQSPAKSEIEEKDKDDSDSASDDEPGSPSSARRSKKNCMKIDKIPGSYEMIWLVILESHKLVMIRISNELSF